MLTRLGVIAVFGFVAGASGAARADAVPPPPEDCAAGAIGETGHNGPYCRPASCTSDADCGHDAFDKRARLCRELALCVVERKEPSASGWSHGTPLTLRVAGPACGDDGACAAGTCERGKHCVLVEAPPTPPEPTRAPPSPDTTASAPTSDGPAKGCGGCEAGDASGAMLVGLALALMRWGGARGA